MVILFFMHYGYAIAHGVSGQGMILILIVIATVVAIPFIVSRFVPWRPAKYFLTVVPVVFPIFLYVFVFWFRSFDFQRQAKKFLGGTHISFDAVEVLKDQAGRDLGLIVEYTVNVTSPLPPYKNDGSSVNTQVSLVDKNDPDNVYLAGFRLEIPPETFTAGAGKTVEEFMRNDVRRIGETSGVPVDKGSHRIKMQFLPAGLLLTKAKDVKLLQADSLKLFATMIDKSQTFVPVLRFNSKITLPHRGGQKYLRIAEIPIPVKAPLEFGPFKDLIRQGIPSATEADQREFLNPIDYPSPRGHD